MGATIGGAMGATMRPARRSVELLLLAGAHVVTIDLAPLLLLLLLRRRRRRRRRRQLPLLLLLLLRLRLRLLQLLLLLLLPGKERLATRKATHAAAVLLLLKAAKVLRRWQPERTGHCRQQAAGRTAAKAKVGKLSARQLRAGKLHAGKLCTW